MSDESNSTFFVCPTCHARSQVSPLNLIVRTYTDDPFYDHTYWECPTPDCPAAAVGMPDPDELGRYIRLGFVEEKAAQAPMTVRVYIRRMLSGDPATHPKPGTRTEIIADFDNAIDTLNGLANVDEFLRLCA